VVFVVEFPKRSGTRKIRCPYCAWRLCDAVGEPECKITAINDYDSNFIIKCQKCGRLIGIALVFNKAQEIIKIKHINT
jgi:DNA-directed RNA polymerase subunit RPC12/RpoP